MSRSIFEEVGEQQPEEPKVVPGAADAEKRRNRSLIAAWLLVLAAMVAAQILVGGLTRLTDSGLSITEWRPVTGAIPPMSEAAWQVELEKYRSTTEYQEQNAGMSLEEFKVIYWWEWGHRQWGRLIGLVFAIGFAVFYFRQMIPAGWTGKLLFVGGLGALQGVIGWWMVASGLVGRLDVSQYRLALHLTLAFVILAFLLWFALSLRRDERFLLQARRRRERGMLPLSGGLLVLLLLQVTMGAFVAGMDGGMIYNQWPKIGDGWLLPSGEPFTPFDAPAAAQSVHRILGYLVVIAAAAFWWRMRGSAHARSRRWAGYFAIAVVVQVVIGVATLAHAAALGWGVLHQAGAVALLAVLILTKHQLAYPEEERISA
ncbi:MAG: COX15/CtaA family protein [Pseudomonadota bacterium]